MFIEYLFLFYITCVIILVFGVTESPI